MDLETGRQVDRYVIEGLLGRGGMAAVYKARHTQLGTMHAIKVLTIASADVRRRMLLEGRVQASLVHPNIVAVSDVVEIDGQPGLVMEMVAGPTLDALLEEHRLTVEQCDAIAEGLFAGLGAAKARGLVHRDLKPANVLLQVTSDGFLPKIADFGLAKLLEDEGSATKTRSGLTMGTPAYMAPEQIRNAKGVDHRADVFALGAILYEMVCGRRAFDGEDLLDIFNSIAQARFPAPREIVPELPERMERAILGALETDREKRIQDVGALRAIWRGESTSTRATTSSPSGPWSSDLVSKYSDAQASGPLTSSPGGSGSYQTWAPGGTVGPSADAPAARSTESLAPKPAPVAKKGRPVGLILGVVAVLALVAIGVCLAGGVGGAGLLAFGSWGEGDAAVATAERGGMTRTTTPEAVVATPTPTPVKPTPVEATPTPTPKPVATPEATPARTPEPAPTPKTPSVEPGRRVVGPGTSPTPATSPGPRTIGPGTETTPDAPANEGTINQNEVDAVLRKRGVAAQACYAAALMRQVAHDHDRAVIKFVVDTDGEADEIRVTSTTLDYPWFRSCLVKVVENTTFPRAKGGNAPVSWPLEFSKIPI